MFLSWETFAVKFETVKTTKVLPIKTFPLYGILLIGISNSWKLLLLIPNLMFSTGGYCLITSHSACNKKHFGNGCHASGHMDYTCSCYCRTGSTKSCWIVKLLCKMVTFNGAMPVSTHTLVKAKLKSISKFCNYVFKGSGDFEIFFHWKFLDIATVVVMIS